MAPVKIVDKSRSDETFYLFALLDLLRAACICLIYLGCLIFRGQLDEPGSLGGSLLDLSRAAQRLEIRDLCLSKVFVANGKPCGQFCG